MRPPLDPAPDAPCPVRPRGGPTGVSAPSAPDAPSTLADLIRGEDRGAGLPGSRLLSVTGARGGLGASTLLIHLAWSLRREGRSTAMVDLDPAGGLGLLLGDEVLPGLRWADLPVRESAFRPGRLIGALPAWHAIPFLTGDGRGGPPPGAVEPGEGQRSCLDAVLEALLSEHDIVLIDLPRGMAAPRGSEVLLVSGLDLHSAVACEALVTRLRDAARAPGAHAAHGAHGAHGIGVQEPRVGLVLRQLGEDVSTGDLELVTGSPVIAALPTDRAIRQRIARGEDPVRSRSAMRRSAGALARLLLAQGPLGPSWAPAAGGPREEPVGAPAPAPGGQALAPGEGGRAGWVAMSAMSAVSAVSAVGPGGADDR